MQHAHRAEPREVGLLREAPRGLGCGVGRAVPDGQGEGRAEEDHHFTRLDVRRPLDEPQGLDRHGQHVAVAFLLRPLVGVDRVLHGEPVQPQVVGQLLELLLPGFVHADPGELVGPQVRQAGQGGLAPAVLLPAVDLLPLIRRLLIDRALHAPPNASTSAFHAPAAGLRRTEIATGGRTPRSAPVTRAVEWSMSMPGTLKPDVGVRGKGRLPEPG